MHDPERNEHEGRNSSEQVAWLRRLCEDTLQATSLLFPDLAFSRLPWLAPLRVFVSNPRRMKRRKQALTLW